MSPIPRIFLALLVLFPISGSAQKPATPETEESAPTFRIAVSAMPPGLTREVHFWTGEGSKPVPVSLFRFSAPEPLPAIDPESPELLLYQAAPTLIEGQANIPKPDTSVPLPPGANKILIVLFPRKTEDGFTLGAHAIDESLFPAGSIYFFNPTPIHVGAVLGEEKIRIEGGQSHLFKSPPLGEGKTFGVQIALHQEEGWKLFASTRWHLTPMERHLVFFKINPRTKKPDYDSLTDYLSLPKDPKPE